MLTKLLAVFLLMDILTMKLMTSAELLEFRSDQLSSGFLDSGTNALRTRQSSSSGQHYCGRLLVAVLHLVCQGRYNGPSTESISSLFSPINVGELIRQERMILSSNTNAAEQQKLSDDWYHRWLKNRLIESGNKNEINDDNTNNRNKRQVQQQQRFRRGIVEECCYNSCSVRQLKEYCINGEENDNIDNGQATTVTTVINQQSQK